MALVDRVVDFYHQSDEFSESIEKWFYGHCCDVDVPPASSSEEVEYQHDVHELYGEYQAFFEKQIERFVVETCGETLETFRDELAQASEEKSGEADTFVYIANASLSFQTFVAMIRFAQEGSL